MRRGKAISTSKFKQIVSERRPGRYYDGAVSGLRLVIDNRGKAYWGLRVMVRGRRREFGLGALDDVGLAESRERARDCRSKIEKGEDPATRGRLKPAAVPTFKQAATMCISEHVKGLSNAKAKQQWTNTLEAYAYPHIGSMYVDKIEAKDVLRVLAPIWIDKQETARRVRQRIEKVLNWCKAHGLRSGDNPASKKIVSEALPKQTKAVKHHAALPFKKVGEFVADLRGSDAEPSTKMAFEFLILTVPRVNELVGARWEEIDWSAREWSIPGPRMKRKRPHIVPLSDRAMEVLEQAKALGSEEYIFPSPTNPRQHP
jgi:integrase